MPSDQTLKDIVVNKLQQRDREDVENLLRRSVSILKRVRDEYMTVVPDEFEVLINIRLIDKFFDDDLLKEVVDETTVSGS